jgi:O-antigen/teichoic acid export membrane protein
VLLGRYWGAEPLGLYGRAYQLGNLPVQQLYNAISNIALSALARTQNDLPRLRRSFLKMYGVAVSVTVPVTVMCAVFADEIIGFLLGAKWAGAADVLRLLAPTLLAFALVNPLGWYMYATGRVGRSVSIAILIAAVVPIGVFAGLSRGPEGVALGLSVAMTALVVPIVVWALYKTGITAADYWDSVKRSLFSGLIAGVAGWAVNTATLGTLPPLARLLLGTSVSLSAYGVVLLVFLGQRDVYDDLLSHAFRRRGTVQTKV